MSSQDSLERNLTLAGKKNRVTSSVYCHASMQCHAAKVSEHTLAVILMPTKIVLRSATLDDAEMLFLWRNDVQTRAASVNEAEIRYDDHISWLTKSLNNSDGKIYIAEENGVPVGTIRTDDSNGISELSWTVAPSHRGHGIGKELVAALARSIAGPLMARVKSTNTASIRIAEYVGMRLLREYDGLCHFERPKA